LVRFAQTAFSVLRQHVAYAQRLSDRLDLLETAHLSSLETITLQYCSLPSQGTSSKIFVDFILDSLFALHNLLHLTINIVSFVGVDANFLKHVAMRWPSLRVEMESDNAFNLAINATLIPVMVCCRVCVNQFKMSTCGSCCSPFCREARMPKTLSDALINYYDIVRNPDVEHVKNYTCWRRFNIEVNSRILDVLWKKDYQHANVRGLVCTKLDFIVFIPETSEIDQKDLSRSNQRSSTSICSCPPPQTAIRTPFYRTVPIHHRYPR